MTRVLWIGAYNNSSYQSIVEQIVENQELKKLWLRTPNVTVVLTSSQPCEHQALEEVLPSDKTRPVKEKRRKERVEEKRKYKCRRGEKRRVE